MSTSIETQRALLDKLMLAVNMAHRSIDCIEKANDNPRNKVAQLWNISNLQDGCFNRHQLPTAHETALFRSRNTDPEEAEKIVGGFEIVKSMYQINRPMIEEIINHEEIEQWMQQSSGTDANLGNSGQFLS
ncbi:hypothetical protein EDC01DRAFT_630681 [Geopyxis carbonaria]|nr:hypothetical protein EDC01DRAFT_630681 [Geopyxis carbonaria]